MALYNDKLWLQAIHCTLADIEPKDATSEWSPEVGLDVKK